MDEYDVLGGYMPSFVRHLQDTAARFGSSTGSQVDADLDPGGTIEEVVDAYESASVSWTSAEHDAFFRAVSVHSRWRPDLIAACIPTRTEWEVWMYLEALEEAAATLAAERDDEDEDVDVVGASGDVTMHDGSSLDSDSCADADEDEDTDACEPALEVSQAWIDVEERMASWIIEQEYLASAEAVAVSDTESMVRKERKRKRKRRRTPGRAQPRATSPESAQGPPQNPAILHRKREALMYHLGVTHLLALDGILKDGQEASKSREVSITGAQTEHGDEENLSLQGPSPTERITAASGTTSLPESLSNVVIDPVLMADAPARDPSLLRNVSQSSSLGMSFHPEDAIHTNPHPTGDDESDSLSPRTRRRIQKRLYMRRKRAQDKTISEDLGDTGIAKLRPGKKAKRERNETPVASVSVPSDTEWEEAKGVRKKSKGGLTLRYKLKAEFARLGVDAAYLGSQGMDLLNLGALGKLMGLYSSLEHEGDGPTMAQSIDAQLIRQLQAAMVSFVTDIIHRAIVWREREIRLKQRNQAWRQSNQITMAAVEHAVDTVGAWYRSHKEYFQSLGTPAPTNATEESGHAETSSVDADVEAAELSVGQPRLSLHRDVYTPLIRPPSERKMSALSCLTQTYEQEATKTRRGPSADVAEELTSDETDEEALAAALEEEDEMDAVDAAQGARAEARLWAGVKIIKD